MIGVVEGCHKIGCTTSAVDLRFSQIESSLPVDLTVLYHAPTAWPFWLEGILHSAFNSKRVKGEWFRLSSEDVSLLLTVGEVNSVSDVPAEIMKRHRNRLRQQKRLEEKTQQWNDEYCNNQFEFEPSWPCPDPQVYEMHLRIRGPKPHKPN